jgi:glycosyltransferase involved in cell wall biosynthesis
MTPRSEVQRRTNSLRVLQVTASVAPRDGGPSVAVLALDRAFRDQGMESIVCSTDADGPRNHLSAGDRDRIRRTGDVRLFRVHWPRRLKTSIGMAGSLYRLVRSADIVHIHYLHAWSSLVAALYARMLGKPYVLQPHGGLEPYHMAKSARVKALFELLSGTLRNADALVVSTETEAAHITSVPPSRKVLVPLGAPTPAASRPPSMNGPRVLFLGRLTTKKRAEILLRAWPLVIERVAAARLEIVGPDTDGLLNRYEALVSRLGLDASVTFRGQLLGDAKSSAFANATVFALPSENESFGIAVAEALGAGLPVVLSKHVAIADEVAAAGAGVVVPSLEPADWAQALVALLENEAALADMRTAARRLVSERYSWDQAGRRLERCYRDLLDATAKR